MARSILPNLAALELDVELASRAASLVGDSTAGRRRWGQLLGCFAQRFCRLGWKPGERHLSTPEPWNPDEVTVWWLALRLGRGCVQGLCDYRSRNDRSLDRDGACLHDHFTAQEGFASGDYAFPKQ